MVLWWSSKMTRYSSISRWRLGYYHIPQNESSEKGTQFKKATNILLVHWFWKMLYCLRFLLSGFHSIRWYHKAKIYNFSVTKIIVIIIIIYFIIVSFASCRTFSVLLNIGLSWTFVDNIRIWSKYYINRYFVFKWMQYALHLP